MHIVQWILLAGWALFVPLLILDTKLIHFLQANKTDGYINTTLKEYAQVKILAVVMIVLFIAIIATNSIMFSPNLAVAGLFVSVSFVLSNINVFFIDSEDVDHSVLRSKINGIARWTWYISIVLLVIGLVFF